uniref:Uncharacterized protein n=1 Tax=Rhizophora mucronata TaxID=61149 RepID=A0A2P2NLP2_RHIMU
MLYYNLGICQRVAYNSSFKMGRYFRYSKLFSSWKEYLPKHCYVEIFF